jgi:hypothetical protein
MRPLKRSISVSRMRLRVVLHLQEFLVVIVRTVLGRVEQDFDGGGLAAREGRAGPWRVKSPGTQAGSESRPHLLSLDDLAI